MVLRRISLDKVASTNTYLRGLSLPVDGTWTLVTTEFQSAGRGAGTNHWESECGKNLLLSLRVCPRQVTVGHVFSLSEAIALSVCETLNTLKPGFCVKWPNDIYYGDRKVAGLLIENDLQGRFISASVMGLGLNVNQMRFLSDAPNPVSLVQVLGHVLDREALLGQLLDQFSIYYNKVEQGETEELHVHYLQRLYRRGVEAVYRDEQGEFRAVLTDVEHDGHLVLTDTGGRKRRYAFKEVQYVLSDVLR